MARTTVRVRVHEAKIQGMHEPGGDIHQFSRRLGRDGARYAVALAPKRTMELANSVGTTTRTYPLRVITNVYASAPHALFVIRGTRRLITSSRPGGWMRLRPGAGWPMMFKRAVAGQAANNFLDEAKRLALAENGII